MVLPHTSLREKVLIRYQVLFGAAILFLAVPFLGDLAEGFVLPLLFTIVALAALTTAAERRGTLIVGVVLAVPSLLAGWLEPTEPTWAIAGGVSKMLFFGWLTAGILMHVVHATRVTSDILFGLACVYILLAATWGIGYGIAETIEPGAIALPSADAGASADLYSLSGQRVRLYFSFVTLTTLGYGDMRPVSDMARILAMLEATLGQLFLVILVARLVGLHTVQLMSGGGETQSGA